jgi:putative flippase GtrA
VKRTAPPRDTGDPSVYGQVLRFGVVGVFGFLTDVGGFNLLRFAGGQGPLYAYPLTAKVVSGVLATIVAWLGNRYWTFRRTRRAEAFREFLLFALVAGIGTLIAMSCLWVSHYLLRLTSPLADNISANVIGLGLALSFRFWAYRRHVFSGQGDGSGLSEVAEHHLHTPEGTRTDATRTDAPNTDATRTDVPDALSPSERRGPGGD